jgi:hypothetical protein
MVVTVMDHILPAPASSVLARLKIRGDRADPDRVMDGVHTSERWASRRRLSRAVRLAASTVPAVAASAVAWAAAGALPRQGGLVASMGWWCMVLALAGLAYVLVDLGARRLLPLSTLLSLSLAFPDHAPSRFRTALRASNVRRMEAQLHAGLSEDISTAAVQILELAAALSVHDRRTRGHAERVRAYSDLIADELGLPAEDRERLQWAALLHDVGKLGIDPDLLNKPGALTAEEWEILRSHPGEGERFIAPLAGWLGPWALAVAEHHERYDGTGYPAGLVGEQISLAGRIVAVADSFEAMTAVRSYHAPKSAEEARDELVRCSGTQFDPTIVRAFMTVSIPRMQSVMGPLAVVAQLPFLGPIATAAPAATAAVGQAAAATALVMSGGIAAPPLLDALPIAPAAEQAVDGALEAAGPVTTVTVTVPAGSDQPALTAEVAAAAAAPVPIPVPVAPEPVTTTTTSTTTTTTTLPPATTAAPAPAPAETTTTAAPESTTTTTTHGAAAPVTVPVAAAPAPSSPATTATTTPPPTAPAAVAPPTTAPTTTAPPTTAATTTTTAAAATVLMVSTSSDRSNLVPLDGRSYSSGSIYVVIPSNGVSRVVFRVDSWDSRTESSTPFDLMGTAWDGRASPLRLDWLGRGSHRVRADVTFTNGETRRIEATFTKS